MKIPGRRKRLRWPYRIRKVSFRIKYFLTERLMDVLDYLTYKVAPKDTKVLIDTQIEKFKEDKRENQRLEKEAKEKKEPEYFIKGIVNDIYGVRYFTGQIYLDIEFSASEIPIEELPLLFDDLAIEFVSSYRANPLRFIFFAEVRDFLGMNKERTNWYIRIMADNSIAALYIGMEVEVKILNKARNWNGIRI